MLMRGPTALALHPCPYEPFSGSSDGTSTKCRTPFRATGSGERPDTHPKWSIIDYI